MNNRLRIRLAVSGDLKQLADLRSVSILDSDGTTYTPAQRKKWAQLDPGKRTNNRILDGSLIVAERNGLLLASCGIDLDRGEMVSLFVHPSHQGLGTGSRMITQTERLAVDFGMTSLQVCAAQPAIEFYGSLGYSATPGTTLAHHDLTGLPTLKMNRSLARRQTRFGKRVSQLLERFNIPATYGQTHRIKLQREAMDLVFADVDMAGRHRELRPGAASAWTNMKAAADSDGIKLYMVSAFRSLDYQAGIIQRKLEKGQTIEQILSVSAAPGFSEHHTGLAVDVATPGSEPLEEEFETTDAYSWLDNNAGDFRYSLSFPRNNRHGVFFEPWHWAYRD